MKRLCDSSCFYEYFDCCRPSLSGIHMTFASETKDEIVTIINQAAGKHRSLWFREIRLPSLLSLKYVIWKRIIASYSVMCFSINTGCLISSSFAHPHGHCNLDIYKMPKGRIINMTKAAAYKLHPRHRLHNFSFSQFSWSGGLYKYSSTESWDGELFAALGMPEHLHLNMLL